MEWSHPYPPLITALVAVVLLLSLWVARRVAISPRLRNWLLFVPRAFVLGGLLIILFNPVRLQENQLPPRRAQVTYLVDCSRSMALDKPRSRLDQVKQTIYRAAEKIPEDDLPQIGHFRFGSQLAAAPSVPQLQPEEEATRLAHALEQLPARFPDDPPKAVVVFSDGQFEPSDNFEDLLLSYERMGVPICVYPVGDESIRGDVAIQELVVPRAARPGTKVPIRATICASGFEGERALLCVRPANSSSTVPLATLPITLASTPKSCEIVVEANRNTPHLVLEIAPLAGEAIVENNRVPFQLSSGDRKLRVIYMEGTTGSEYRYIQTALTEDPDIECLSMVVNAQYAARPRLQRVNDPYRGYPTTREELFKYDVVICSDISQGAFTREQMAWTVELVGDRGGGFAMVGGHTSYGAGRWDSTSWDKLIPVDMSGGPIGSGYLTQQFRVTVPPQAYDHPIWRLVEDPERNRRALQSMPVFYGTNLIRRLKPAATLLGQSSSALRRVGVMPVFACESYGRGRTFAMATDSTFHWGQAFERSWGEGDNRYFRKFWRNVIRWLSENSIAGSKRLSIDSDKVIYRAGEPIRVSAVAYDTSYNETVDYRLAARLRPDQGEESSSNSIMLTPVVALQRYEGELEARLPSLPENEAARPASTLQTAKLEVVASDGNREVGRSTLAVQILHDSRELLRPQPVPDNLRQLANETNGVVLDGSNDLAELLLRFPAAPGEVIVHRSPTWDRTWFWGLLILLLGVEWSLRRRAGFG